MKGEGWINNIADFPSTMKKEKCLNCEEEVDSVQLEIHSLQCRISLLPFFWTSLLPNNGDQMVKKLCHQILPKIAKMMVTLLLYFQVSGLLVLTISVLVRNYGTSSYKVSLA